MNKNQKKKKIMIISLVISFFLLFIGISYALWQITLIQEEKNLVTSACFEVTLEEQNDIQLNKAYPITESEGQALTPYTFTITNVCSTTAMYQVNLEELEISGKKLSSDYVSVSLNKSQGKILSSYEEVAKTLNNATTSRKLTTGSLRENESKTYELRLWMDYDTPPSEEVMESSFESKITIIAVHNDDLPEVLVKAREEEDGITVDISTVSNPKSEELTYFYRLNEESEIESSESTHTFTGLSDGKYKAKGRAETIDGVILEEKELDVTVAYQKVYISSSGSDSTGNGSIESPYASLQPAYNKVKSGGEMILLSDITATETTIMNIENKSVTLRSEGENQYSVFRGDELTTQILNITNSNTITTTNIIFDGREIEAITALLQTSSSTLNLNDGTIVQNGKKIEGYGAAGIQVNMESTMNIYDVLITNNKSINSSEAGGVILTSSSILNMYGGRIENNFGGTSAGGVYIWESIFYMYGGWIENNHAVRHGGGIVVHRGSDTIQSIAYLKGGEIKNNVSSSNPDMIAFNGAQIIDERTN